MLEKFRVTDLRAAIFTPASLIFALLFLLATTGFAQTTGSESNAQAATVTKTEMQKSVKPTTLTPVFKNYRDIAIGMTADEVKDKLGKAEIADKTRFYYKFSGGESAQIMLDANKKVRAISIMYSEKDENAPKFEDVFGKETTIEAGANGKIYKMVNYPEAGYWVAYSKSGGDNQMVIVTMQKM